MSQLPAPALVLPQPPGSGAAGISLAVPARCFSQLDSSCRALPHPLLLPVALPLLSETGLVWRGKQMHGGNLSCFRLCWGWLVPLC